MAVHVMLRAIPAIKLGTCRYSVMISFMFGVIGFCFCFCFGFLLLNTRLAARASGVRVVAVTGRASSHCCKLVSYGGCVTGQTPLFVKFRLSCHCGTTVGFRPALAGGKGYSRMKTKTAIMGKNTPTISSDHPTILSLRGWF